MSVPKKVLYCPICTLPVEYCMYSPTPGRCKDWLRDQHPDILPLIYPAEKAQAEAAAGELGAALQQVALPSDGGEKPDEAGSKHQSRGGKGLPRDESQKLKREEEKRKKARVVVKREDRNKRKSVTHIRGMEAFGLDLKKVAKRLAGKYACGCSVVQAPAGYEEVVLQGDFVDDLLEFIPAEWPEVPDSQIDHVDK